MNNDTLATRTIVKICHIETPGYLLPTALWTPTSKFGVSKTQAALLAYPDFSRNQAATKCTEVLRTRVARILAPDGINILKRVKTSGGQGDGAFVDLMREEDVILFLKIAKRLGSIEADNILDGFTEKLARASAISKKTKKSVVYFLFERKHKAVKIGTTETLEKRIKSIERCCPIKLILLRTIPGDYRKEAEWHKFFAKNRLNGEWFEATPLLLKSIKSGKLPSRSQKPL